MIHYHDPRAPSATPVTAYGLHTELRGSNQSHIGFLANGFPDSEAFLEQVANAMQTRLPGMTPAFWNKGNASIPAPADMLEDIQDRCSALVAAYGH
ncbi:MAG: hypothetical protein EA417_16405 [Gammaproteobacteria bacterium]|nr:MAG: hypothetical protein EA417_16405 [Gammaproteobacteria bacterium]